MIKHIVMWNFADEAEGAEKATNLRTVRDRLAAGRPGAFPLPRSHREPGFRRRPGMKRRTAMGLPQ